MTRPSGQAAPARRHALPVQLRHCAAWAAVFALAVVIGRGTRVGDTQLAMFWPAAGIAVLWANHTWRSTAWTLGNATVLFWLTAALNYLTGAPTGLSALFAVVNLLHAWVGWVLLRRWLGLGPQLPLSRAINRPSSLMVVLAVSFLASVASGAVLTAAVQAVHWASAATHADRGDWHLTATSGLLSLGIWVVRNTASTLIVITVATQLRGSRRDRARPYRTTELVLLFGSSGLVSGYVFGLRHDVRLDFLMMPLLAWASLRFSQRAAGAHLALTATSMLTAAAVEAGDFATVTEPAPVAVAQLFLLVLACVSVALSLYHHDRERILAQMAAAEASARSKSELLDAVLDTISDGVVAIDAQHRVQLRNTAAAAGIIAGPSRTTTAADPLSDAVQLRRADGTPMTESDLPIIRAARGEGPQREDVLVADETAEEPRIVEVRAAALPEDHGAVAVFRDVTRERRHTAQLTAFAGMVAHDLKNPLSALTGWLEDLAELLDALPASMAVRARTDVQRMDAAAARMRQLIEDLLSYSVARDQPAQLTDVDISRLAEDVVAEHRERLLATGTEQLPQFVVEEIPVVRADPVLARQLVENLVSNALKYRDPQRPPIVHLRAGDPQNLPGWRRIELADNGLGIPPAQRENVFKEFVRIHQGTGVGGTGLGLPMCRRIVQRHGGAISAMGNELGGTSMVFTLPAGTARPGPATSAALPAPRRDAVTCSRR